MTWQISFAMHNEPKLYEVAKMSRDFHHFRTIVTSKGSYIDQSSPLYKLSLYEDEIDMTELDHEILLLKARIKEK
jgi:hypothetical protein